jgi:hypothetical protein
MPIQQDKEPQRLSKVRKRREKKRSDAPGLVGDVGAKVPAHDAVPRGVVLLVKLLLDVRGNVLLYVILLQGLNRRLINEKTNQNTSVRNVV